MVLVAKVASIFLLLGITFIFGITPIWLLKVMANKMKDLSRLQYYVSLMNCFAGGVFLGTSILHLIQESMDKVAESIPEVTYPLAGVLIGVGFFIVLLLEHIIGIISKDDDNPFLDHGHEHVSHDHASDAPRSEKPKVDKDDGPKPGKVNPGFNTEEKPGDEVLPVSYHSLAETSFAVGGSVSLSNGSVSLSNGSAAGTGNDTNNKSAIMDLSGDGRSKTQKRIRTVILVIALSIHMIFEGMAIGLQDTESSTWTLTVAISIHKVIVVFSVCLKMKEIINNNVLIILYILYLAAVSPIGIAIGLVISSTGSAGSAQDISSGVLQSLAAGTFVYVTFFEILQKELTNGYSLLKVFLTLLGFGVMAALKVLDTD